MSDQEVSLPPAVALHRHVTVVHLGAPTDQPGFTTYFEPEGSERFLKPGDSLTITFDSDRPQEIDLALHKDGLIFWRPTRGDVRVSIIDQHSGEEITELW
jgi:hypothetical protein